MAITKHISKLMEHIKEVLKDIVKENTTNPHINFDISKIYDIEIEGIDLKDSPDFCDAYISKALYDLLIPRELTEEECIQIQDDNPEWFYEKVCDEAYGE
tara:strand:+ start:985 stop:1284 length:300 start_codon:yes stop_codon:yes gene_type:complete